MIASLAAKKPTTNGTICSDITFLILHDQLGIVDSAGTCLCMNPPVKMRRVLTQFMFDN